MADAEELRSAGAPQTAPANGTGEPSQPAPARQDPKADAAPRPRAEKAGKPAAAPKPRKTTSAKKPAPADPITMLKEDHRKVEALFASFGEARNRTQKQRIVAEVCAALKLHAELEERVFYPATREHGDQDDKIDEAQVEHDTVTLLIRELEGAAPDSPFYAVKVKVLSHYVRHHVTEEEAPDGILETARKAGVDLARVGEDMARLRERLERDPSQLRARTLALGQSRQQTPAKENEMARNTGNGDYGQGMRGTRDRTASGREGRGYDPQDYDRSRDARRHSESREENDRRGTIAASPGGSARDERPRRFGGAEGFNEASRRAAEAQGRGQSRDQGSAEGRHPRNASSGTRDRAPETQGQRSRERTMRQPTRDWSDNRSGRWEGGPQSRH